MGIEIIIKKDTINAKLKNLYHNGNHIVSLFILIIINIFAP